MNMNSKYNFILLLFFFLLIGIILLFSLFYNSSKETMETLSNLNNLNIPEQPLFLTLSNDFLNTDLSKDFCKFNQNSLENSCNNLTSFNCLATDYCVLLNGNKCVAGSEKGPTYLTNMDGTKVNIDYYYYMKKCFGLNCPK